MKAAGGFSPQGDPLSMWCSAVGALHTNSQRVGEKRFCREFLLEYCHQVTVPSVPANPGPSRWWGDRQQFRDARGRSDENGLQAGRRSGDKAGSQAAFQPRRSGPPDQLPEGPSVVLPLVPKSSYATARRSGASWQGTDTEISHTKPAASPLPDASRTIDYFPWYWCINMGYCCVDHVNFGQNQLSSARAAR